MNRLKPSSKKKISSILQREVKKKLNWIKLNQVRLLKKQKTKNWTWKY